MIWPAFSRKISTGNERNSVRTELKFADTHQNNCPVVGRSECFCCCSKRTNAEQRTNAETQMRTKTWIWVWLKIQEPGDHWFWSTFPLARFFFVGPDFLSRIHMGSYMPRPRPLQDELPSLSVPVGYSPQPMFSMSSQTTLTSDSAREMFTDFYL